MYEYLPPEATEGTRALVDRANNEARRLAYGYLGTEHLFLAAIQDNSPCIHKALGNVDLGKARELAAEMYSPDERVTGKEVLPLTPNAEKVLLEFAPQVAKRIGSSTIEPAHVVVAVAQRRGSAYAHPIMVSLGLSPQRVADEILACIQSDGGIAEQVELVSNAVAKKDLLNREGLADGLAERLNRAHESEERSSLLIHLDGPWGAGKSTFLRFLRQRLEYSPKEEPGSSPKWVVIEFDAWRQSRLGPSWWALLAALRNGVKDSQGWSGRAAFRIVEALKRIRLAGPAYLMALTLLLSITVLIAIFWFRPSNLRSESVRAFLGSVAAIGTTVGVLWVAVLAAGRFLFWDSPRGARVFEQSNTNPMEDLAAHFGWLVARAHGPVIFLIDNLDRCPESYVVELLDAIQTLIRDSGGRAERADLKISAPYFIIAADGRWIRQSYETAYKEFGASVTEPGKPLGYLFLEKIFQLTILIPSFNTSRRERYLRNILALNDVPSSSNEAERKEQQEELRKNLNASSAAHQIKEAYYSAPPEIREQETALAVRRINAPEVLAATEHSLEKFGPLLESNPRSMKRFVNAYSIAESICLIEGNMVQSDTLALWTILQIRWPLLADYLRATPELIEELDKRAPDADSFPEPLRRLWGTSEVAKVIGFPHGGRLTAERIRACCGIADIEESGKNEWSLAANRQGPQSTDAPS